MTHLSPSTITFLANLSKNNTTKWMHAHKPEYEAAKADALELGNAIIVGMRQFTEMGDITANKCLFRINRDIRFSKDKTPYKTSFGFHFAPLGRKSHNAAYYLKILPKDSCLAGGLYCMENSTLGTIRDALSADSKDLKQVIAKKAFVDTFGELKGEKLKSAPRGYDKEHPDIELLKMKQFYVSHSVTQKALTSKDCIPYILDVFKKVQPLNEYLNKIAT